MSEETTATPQPAAQPISKATRNYTLAVIIMIYTSSHIDRQIVSILAESIKIELQLSDTQLGFLIGLSFALFYATLGIPIAILADRYSRRNIIAASVIIWSGMTAACGLATNFFQLALARVGVGIGEAGSNPPSHSMISDLFPPEQRATAFGIYSSGINLAVLIGFWGGGYIDENFGWRYAFFIVGIPGIFLGLLLLATTKEPPRQAPPPPVARKRDYALEVWHTFKLMMTIPSLRNVLIGCTLVVFVGYGSVYWNGVYLRRIHELSSLEAGIILALIGGIIGGIGTFFGGWLADQMAKYDKRAYVWITAVVKVALLPLVFVVYLTEDLTTLKYAMAFTSFVGGFYLSVSFALIQTLLPPHRRALGVAILLFCINILGLGLGPQLVGILSDYFYTDYGRDGLRYALICVSMLNLWGAWHYFRAGKTLREDLKNAA